MRSYVPSEICVNPAFETIHMSNEKPSNFSLFQDQTRKEALWPHRLLRGVITRVSHMCSYDKEGLPELDYSRLLEGAPEKGRRDLSGLSPSQPSSRPMAET